ncbi:hypothetical protein BGZ65_002545, partial [Modicella reniformis]
TTKTSTSPVVPLMDQEYAMDAIANVVDRYYDKFEHFIQCHNAMARPIYDSLVQKHLNLTDHLFESTHNKSKAKVDVIGDIGTESSFGESNQGLRNTGVIYRDGSHVDWTWVAKELQRQLRHQYQENDHQHQLQHRPQRDGLTNSSRERGSDADEWVVDNNSDTEGNSDDIDVTTMYTPQRCRSLWRLQHSAKLDIRATYDPLFDQPSNYKRRRLMCNNKLGSLETEDDATSIQPPSLLVRLQKDRSSLLGELSGGPWDQEEIRVLMGALGTFADKVEHAETLRREIVNIGTDNVMADIGGLKQVAGDRQADFRRTCSMPPLEDVGKVVKHQASIDWSEIQRQYLPWRREAEIALQGFMIVNRLCQEVPTLTRE